MPRVSRRSVMRGGEGDTRHCKVGDGGWSDKPMTRDACCALGEEAKESAKGSPPWPNACPKPEPAVPPQVEQEETVVGGARRRRRAGRVTRRRRSSGRRSAGRRGRRSAGRGARRVTRRRRRSAGRR